MTLPYSVRKLWGTLETYASTSHFHLKMALYGYAGFERNSPSNRHQGGLLPSVAFFEHWLLIWGTDVRMLRPNHICICGKGGRCEHCFRVLTNVLMFPSGEPQSPVVPPVRDITDEELNARWAALVELDARWVAFVSQDATSTGGLR